ncbi:MAG TPA: tetratricopeptide repeat protein, partial [Longimicrobiaceae bacterium]|nr:tetratricopeptide repeat protein [Longimicrobiaceae bacterium]
QGLGNVHVAGGRWDAARGWYVRAIALLSDRPPSRPLWQCCSNLAVAARCTGDLEGSREWLDRGEDVVWMLDDPQGVLPLENGRARLHAARGDLARAEEAYGRALAAEGTPALRGAVMVNLAECLLRQGKVDEARVLAGEIETLAVVHGLEMLLPHARRALERVERNTAAVRARPRAAAAPGATPGWEGREAWT